jgi:hypothetical protein
MRSSGSGFRFEQYTKTRWFPTLALSEVGITQDRSRILANDGKDLYLLRAATRI